MKALFEKYLNGQASSQEVEELQNHINDMSGAELEEELSDEMWKEWSNHEPSHRLHPEYKKLLYSKIVAKAPPSPQVSRRQSKFKMLAVAASVILLLTAGMVYFTSVPKYEKLSTYGGEHRTVFLPDGSRVVINGNSEIKYRSDWDESEPREVWLNGEAFFAIQKTPERKEPKFIVHSGNVNVQVLGTSFNVRSDSKKTEVMLETGHVNLISDRDKRVQMIPGEKVTVLGQSEQIIKEKVQPANYRSWINNQLNFENIELRELARRVDDTFGVQLTFSDELNNKRFTGVAHLHKIDEFIRILESAFQIELDRVSNKEFIMR